MSAQRDAKSEEIRWDLLDRCILPVVYSHALAIILSTTLQTLRISQVSCFAYFFWFLVVSLSVVLFYHNLQVTAAGKAVFITSCDCPNGFYLAKQLDDLGYTVFAGFADSGNSGRLKEECSGRLGIVEIDVTSDLSVQRAREFIQNHLPSGSPGLWALVNNYTCALSGEFNMLPLEAYQKSMDVNYIGVLRLSRCFLTSLKKTNGRIINVSSIAGSVPCEKKSALCSSKSALMTFTECARSELKKLGVDVVLVETGIQSATTWSPDRNGIENGRKFSGYEKDENYNCYYTNDKLDSKTRSEPGYIARTPKNVAVGATNKALSDAICRTFPLPHYMAVTFQERLQILIAQHLPYSVYNVLYS